MKVKDVRQHISGHFGVAVAAGLKNPDITEALKALGCWDKTISRVDHVLAVRIKGDQPEQSQFT